MVQRGRAMYEPGKCVLELKRRPANFCRPSLLVPWAIRARCEIRCGGRLQAAQGRLKPAPTPW